jgi:hypothetical protein
MYSGRLEGSQLIGNGLDIGERTKCQQREESSIPINRQEDLDLSAKLRDIWGESTQLIPITLPRRLQISKYGGMRPATSRTLATTPRIIMG